MLSTLVYLFFYENTNTINGFIYWNEFVQMILINSFFVFMYLYIL